jgi:hypothetical protein
MIYDDDYFPYIEVTPETIKRLSAVLKGVPDDEKEAAAQRFIRYLQIVIAIVDEAEENNNPTVG